MARRFSEGMIERFEFKKFTADYADLHRSDDLIERVGEREIERFAEHNFSESAVRGFERLRTNLIVLSKSPVLKRARGPHSLAATRRSFAFYVAYPIRPIPAFLIG